MSSILCHLSLSALCDLFQRHSASSSVDTGAHHLTPVALGLEWMEKLGRRLKACVVTRVEGFICLGV